MVLVFVVQRSTKYHSCMNDNEADGHTNFIQTRMVMCSILEAMLLILHLNLVPGLPDLFIVCEKRGEPGVQWCAHEFFGGRVCDGDKQAWAATSEYLTKYGYLTKSDSFSASCSIEKLRVGLEYEVICT